MSSESVNDEGSSIQRESLIIHRSAGRRVGAINNIVEAKSA
jgi:hypothetical protein